MLTHVIALQAWDGIVGAIIPARRQFITSPNATEIPTPPHQISHVTLREDGRWGPDDPFQCPQLYERQFCHYGCILKRIQDTNDSRWIMWWTPKEAELSHDPLVRRRFSVGRVHLTAFDDCVSKLVAEFLKDATALRTEANSQWVNMLVNQLQIWFNRLSTFATTFPNILFLVAEVQRRWLDLRAYIDYMILVKQELAKLRSSVAKFPPCHPFIGAITDNQTVAEEFASVGVPVWLLRDLSEFSTNTRVKTVVPLQETSTSIQPFPGVSRSIFVGPSNSAAKYDAIYKYARQHFSSAHEVDPPTPLLLAAAHASVDERPTKRFKVQAATSRLKARGM